MTQRLLLIATQSDDQDTAHQYLSICIGEMSDMSVYVISYGEGWAVYNSVDSEYQTGYSL